MMHQNSNRVQQHHSIKARERNSKQKSILNKSLVSFSYIKKKEGKTLKGKKNRMSFSP